MHELLDREDPYSYYRGQSENMRNLTPKERVMKVLWIGVPLASIAALAYKWYREEQERETAEHVKGQPRERQTLINWSGTHQVITKKLWEPESLAELEQLVINSHMARTKLRVTGAGLSPNGISFERGGMVSLALMDKIGEMPLSPAESSACLESLFWCLPASLPACLPASYSNLAARLHCLIKLCNGDPYLNGFSITLFEAGPVADKNAWRCTQ